MRRFLPLVLAAVLSLLATACDVAPEHPDTAVKDPLLAWTVGSVDSCGATADEVRAQAAGLVAHGLRDRGFRTLLILCDGDPAVLHDGAVSSSLAAQGLTLRSARRGSRLARASIMASMPRVESLRTAVTRNVMKAEPLVFGGNIDQLPAENLAVVSNPSVLALALDDRGAPGGVVAGDAEVESRAVGQTGLLVSLTNGSGAPREVSVALDALNLAGSDSVPATDVWTGQRIVSADGRLSMILASGDSALLRIG
ncbi:MAG: hypothetical protein QM658_05235 [Gordonia sp. (in: high G+C Gram-positive bacteria)]